MKHLRLKRITVASVMAVAPLVAVGTFAASPASAATKFVGIKCLEISGTLTTNVTLNVCNGHTGTSSKPFSASVLLAGGTITWSNGKTTTINATASEGGKTGGCLSGSVEMTTSGTTTADTTGSAPVGGKVKMQWCLTEQTVTQASGTADKIG